MASYHFCYVPGLCCNDRLFGIQCAHTESCQKDPLITAYLPAVLESKTISKACLIDLFNVTKVFKFIDTFGSTGGAKRRKKLKKM